MDTAYSFSGREDAAHAEKDEKYRRLGEYAGAAMQDYYRMRNTLYDLEQKCIRSAENIPEHADSYRHLADEARAALRNYYPEAHGA